MPATGPVEISQNSGRPSRINPRSLIVEDVEGALLLLRQAGSCPSPACRPLRLSTTSEQMGTTLWMMGTMY